MFSRRSALALLSCAVVAGIPHLAFAVQLNMPTNPNVQSIQIRLPGYAAGSRPELDGDTLAHQFLQYNGPHPGDIITIEQTVVREHGTGHLDFYNRILPSRPITLPSIDLAPIHDVTADLDYQTMAGQPNSIDGGISDLSGRFAGSPNLGGIAIIFRLSISFDPSTHNVPTTGSPWLLYRSNAVNFTSTGLVQLGILEGTNIQAIISGAYVPTAVPEPGSLLILGLAVPVLMRKQQGTGAKKSVQEDRNH